MVAFLLRLRLTQLANAWRRRPAQLLGAVLLLALGVAATKLLLETFDSFATSDIASARAGIVLIGSSITLAFFVVPLLFVADDIADPRAFSRMAVAPGPVAAGLALSRLLSIPSLFLIVIAVAQIGLWSQRGAMLVAIAAAVLIIATGVLGARVMHTVGLLLFSGHRLRELASGLGILSALAVTPFVLVFLLGKQDLLFMASAEEVVEVLAATPLGLAWAAPADAASGDTEAAWLGLGIALAFVALLWFAWRALVGWMISRSPRAAVVTSARRSLGWFDWLPATPIGVVAARSFSYWARDGRYKFSLAVLPVVSLLIVIPFLVIGMWWQNLALVPLPVMCLFLGWMLHNDLAHDNTALWLHVASDTSGWADRFGRAVPVLLLGVPLIGLLAPLTAALYGDWSVLPLVIGVSVSVLLSGVGISSYTSVRMPYAAVRPGASPFAQPQSSGSSAGQTVAFFGTIAAAIPSLALAGMALAYGEDWPLATLVGGPLWGLIVLLGGVAAGARIFGRRAPELLAFALRN